MKEEQALMPRALASVGKMEGCGNRCEKGSSAVLQKEGKACSEMGGAGIWLSHGAFP